MFDQFEKFSIGEDKPKKIKEESKAQELDELALKDIEKQLKKHSDLIVDPNYNKLANVRIKRAPNRNHVCPCNSGHRYKKCCEGRDLVKKNEMLGEIERYLSGEDKPSNNMNGKMLFV